MASMGLFYSMHCALQYLCPGLQLPRWITKISRLGLQLPRWITQNKASWIAAATVDYSK